MTDHARMARAIDRGRLHRFSDAEDPSETFSLADLVRLNEDEHVSTVADWLEALAGLRVGESVVLHVSPITRIDDKVSA